MDVYGRLEIINLDGALVFCRNLQWFEPELEIDKINLPEGVYLVRFISDLGQVTRKLVKQLSYEEELYLQYE